MRQHAPTATYHYLLHDGRNLNNQRASKKISFLARQEPKTQMPPSQQNGQISVSQNYDIFQAETILPSVY